MWATGATGVALALAPPLSALAQTNDPPEEDDPDMGWELVGEEETYDNNYDYQFFHEGDEEGWMKVEEEEPFDHEMYHYQEDVYYEDGTRTEWVEARPEEPLNTDEYDYEDWETGEPIVYEFVDVEPEDANFFYSHQYDYPEGDFWHWIVPGEEYDNENYEYAYEVYEMGSG